MKCILAVFVKTIILEIQVRMTESQYRKFGLRSREVLQKGILNALRLHWDSVLGYTTDIFVECLLNLLCTIMCCIKNVHSLYKTKTLYK